MMRRDAKAMVAYSDLAELKAALDPRQRFVDEITPVDRSMAEVSRGQSLLSSAGRAAPLTGGLTAGPRARAKNCRRVAAIGRIARAFGAMDRVSPACTRPTTIPAEPLAGLDLFQLGCTSKMRGTNQSARVTGAMGSLPVPVAKWWPKMPNPQGTRSPCSGLVEKSTSNGCLGPALLPGGADTMATGTRLNF